MSETIESVLLTKPTPKRRFRFRLRTLLVVTVVFGFGWFALKSKKAQVEPPAEPATAADGWSVYKAGTHLVDDAVAIGLGLNRLCIAADLAVSKLNQVRRQRRAVETIQAHGGHIAYDYQYDHFSPLNRIPGAEPPGPDWIRKLAGDDFFAHVVLVFATEVEFPDPALLADLPQLRFVHLDCAAVSDLTPLANLRELRHLNLNNTVWYASTFSDLTPLAKLENLETLNISGSLVTDLTPLEYLQKLRVLHITKTRVSQGEERRLQRALPDLWIVRIE